MNETIATARTRLVVGAITVAVLAPAALFAAQYPKWWNWIALEQTPMTWLQSVLLVLSAAAAASVAFVVRLRGEQRWARVPYAVLAAGFLALALDERFAVHERIRDRILAPRELSIPGLSWIAPGDFQMILVAIAGLLFLPVLVKAMRADRLALTLLGLGVLAAALAVGMDSIDPATMPLRTERIEQTAEECVELLADCLFFAAMGVRLLGLLGPLIATAEAAGEPLVRAEAADRGDSAGDLHSDPASPGQRSPDLVSAHADQP